MYVNTFKEIKGRIRSKTIYRTTEIKTSKEGLTGLNMGKKRINKLGDKSTSIKHRDKETEKKVERYR